MLEHVEQVGGISVLHEGETEIILLLMYQSVFSIAKVTKQQNLDKNLSDLAQVLF